MEREERFAKRISELRQQKGVSAREMSLSLGQSESYINKIENKKSFPSLLGFFYICEYLDITPKDFFDFDNVDPNITKELLDEIRKLDYKETVHILDLIKDITKKK